MSEVRKLIDTIVRAHNRLRKLKVMRSQRFVADYGEWLVEKFFKGIRSTKKNEKGWDVLIGKKKVQVKTHAKSTNNPNARTPIRCNEETNFHELILIILSQDFYIKAIYRVSKKKLIKLLDADGKVSWRKLRKHKIPNERLFKIRAIRPFLYTQDH